jgi:hypothetical protein
VDHPAVLIDRAAQAGEQARVRDEARTHEHRRARDHGPAAQVDALEPVVADDEPGDCALDDADATGGKKPGLLTLGALSIPSDRDGPRRSSR